MKRGIAILFLLTILFLPVILAEVPIGENPFKIETPPTTQPKPTINPWNETIIISPVWQQLIGTFFGLNLKNVSTEVSVKEVLVFFSIFIMFLVLIYDILKLTPFFKTNLGPVSGEAVVATTVTILVSFSGAFINLKDLFASAVTFTITKLDWGWLNSATQHQTPFTIIIGMCILIGFLAIWAFFDWFNPLIARYSRVSRAQAKGRRLNSVIEKTNITE